ncbi:asparagine synthase (glutamine-hydrolyzing) [Flexithrix dorotheae]|uniref:asparagine synthase (glutamine-hydrolyzing) n=1 Tax=Flexithrix dorotheae TaxID=70993 RepID=UPI000380BE71|nr:asparagine synthase (glutamine-hydrolyzing) [Flexithrix dorotheae]
MCGIAGILGEVGSREEKMQIMLDVQHHRGPDARGVWKDENFILGHNRLSIIDLHEEANQPMISNCGQYILVFNGEIYNYEELRKELKNRYSFKTQSDTEVLIAAYICWKEDMLNRLNGMFAFALWDKRNQKLFAARDRFGVKPFYYAYDIHGNFYFASEIKTLHVAGIPKKRNEGVWASFLTRGYYQYKNKTFWKNIFQLESGHYFYIGLNGDRKFKTERWYHFIDRINKLKADKAYLSRSKEEHLEQYQYLLEDSIQLRFKADVTVGFNISGGLDSSTLLGAVDHLFPNEEIEAFTFYCDDERYDELPWVEKLIAATNKDLNKVLLTAEEVPELSEKVGYFQDEPYGGIPTIAYSKIFERAKQKGIKVLLDGQGMDEAWAGYDYYHQNSDAIVQGVNSSPFKPEVLTEQFKSNALIEAYPKPFEEDLLNKQYRDLFYTKIPRALRFNDRVSMMHSTELREPFLDYRLIEYAFALPLSMKIHEGKVKWALRELANKYLKSEIILAPKRPLQTPQREWLGNELLHFVEEKINRFSKHNVVIPEKLIELWEAYKDGQSENSFFVWQWINFTLVSKL